MGIAVLSDIHGNYVALERCVRFALDRGIKQFLFLGDYLGELAFPQRTMEIIYSLKENIHSGSPVHLSALIGFLYPCLHPRPFMKNNNGLAKFIRSHFIKALSGAVEAFDGNKTIGPFGLIV